MTRILRLCGESGALEYDLVGGALRATLNNYYETMTSDGLLERRYGLYGTTDTHTALEIMEAFKQLERVARLGSEWHARPYEHESIWLEESAADEVPYKRALVYRMETRRQAVPLVSDPLMGYESLIGELAIVTLPAHESSVARTAVNASGVSVLGGLATFGPGGTTEGRVARLTIGPPFGTYAYNAWVGIRPINAGIDDFNPIVSFSANPTGAIAGITTIVDANAYSGQAVQINHSLVPSPTTLTPRHLTSIALAHPSGDLRHWNGRYRAILRYKIVGTAAQIALKIYYGTVSTGSLDVGIPLDTVYLNGTADTYRTVDVGEVVLPFYAHYGQTALTAISAANDCGFLAATEFIDGTAATDHLSIAEIILIPADRLAMCENFDQVWTRVNWLTAENGNTAVLGDYGYAVEGANTLSLPPGGGIVVVLVEDAGVSSKTDVVDLTVISYSRYGRYAGNG